VGWTKVPVVIDDYIEHAQWDEIYLAIKEREDALGISGLVEQTAQDSYIEAVHVNYYRGRIETLIPRFAKWTTGKARAKAEFLAETIGQSDWTRIPARDGGLTTGELQAEDYIYAEHANELKTAIDDLVYAIFECENFAIGGGAFKDGEGEDMDFGIAKSNALSMYASYTPVANSYGGGVGTSEFVTHDEEEGWWFYSCEGDCRTQFATLGTLPGTGILDARVCLYCGDSGFDNTIDADFDCNIYSENAPDPSTGSDLWNLGGSSIGSANTSGVANDGADHYYLIIDVDYGGFASTGEIGFRAAGGSVGNLSGVGTWNESLTPSGMRLVLPLDWEYTTPAP